MKRKPYTIFIIVFWSVVAVFACFMFWREDHQQSLNHHLIVAITRDDTPSALLALKLGADANTRDEPNVPTWTRIWDLFRGHRLPPCAAPTALHLSLQYRASVDPINRLFPPENLKLAGALLGHGARVDATDEMGLTPLWYAIHGKEIASIEMLIRHGANMTALQGNEYLLNAAIYYERDAATVDLMLRSGADPNRMDAHGITPLICSIQIHDAVNVRTLLHYHADPNGTSKVFLNGMRPLAYAEKRHMIDIAAILMNAGAKE